MRQEYWYIILIAVVAGVLVYQFVSREKRTKKRYLGQILSSWGNVPNREYDYGEIEKIAKYYEETKKGWSIDDITWADLDLDQLYTMLNISRSSVGDDFLYKMLRCPLMDPEELEERRRVIDFFREHESIRIKYQMELSRIGHSKKYKMIEYVNTLTSVIPESNLQNYLQLGLYVLGIIMIILQPASGILAFLVILVYNIYTYFKKKSSIEPYFVTVAGIVHLINCAQEVLRLNVSELKEYSDRIRESARILNSVKKDSKFLGSVSTMGGMSAGGGIGSVLTDYLNMLFRLDLIKFNKLIAKLQKNREDILVLMEELGRIDAYISVASFREMLPFCCDAELTVEQKAGVDAKDLYHPLLTEPVANSISETKPVLLTGSNASGKSTFLKTVAISQLLAQTCGIALAKSYRGNYVRLYTSMALKDNIQASESYFIVEIKSLKRIMDAAATEGLPVMCFIDEVLRGTNTVERIAASSRILEHFAKDGVLCYAATHDIELTQLLEQLYANYHFKEEVRDNDVIFNYRLYEGKATTRNAIRLLGILGYDESVIADADATAARFLKDGVWSLEG